MFERIKKYFTLPVFEDEERMRVSRLLITILMTLFVVILLVDVFLVAEYGLPTRWADISPYLALALIGASTLGSYALIRRGMVTALSIGVLSLMWLAVTYWLWTVEGFSGGRTSYLYVLFVVVAGLLLGARGAMAYMILALIGIVGALYIESRGLFPDVVPASVFDIVVVFAILVLIGFFLRYAMRSMGDAILRARRSARAQAEANRELDAIRLSLEERVAARTQDLESRSTLLQTAIELGRIAASLRDLEELLSHIPQRVAERLDFYHVGLFLVDEYGEFAVLRGANSFEGQQMMAQDYRSAVGAPDLLGAVTAKRELRVAVDVGPNAMAFADSPFPRTRSELVLPLVAGDRLIGALDLHSTEHDILTDQMIEIMHLLADQIAIAIESAQLFAQSQAALAAELRAYGTVSREAWREMSRAEGGLRFLSDAPGVIRPVSGDKAAADRSAVMQQARQTGRSVVKPAVMEADSTGLTTLLAVPIQIREGVSIGALRLNKSTWSEDEITLVETLTEQLGAALESARLYQETQRREARERITREITEDIRRSVDMEVILKAAVSNLGEALGVPRTYVHLMLSEESPGEEVTSQESLDEEVLGEELLTEDLSGEDLLDGSPSDESPPEDVDTPSAALVDDAGDASEILPSSDTPDASAIVMDEGEEHDEP